MVSDRATQWSVVMWLPTGQRVWMVSEVVSVNKAGGGGTQWKRGLLMVSEQGLHNGQWKWGLLMVNDGVTVSERGLPNGQ